MFRLGTLLLVIWFAIGALAAWQRDYFKGNNVTCAKGTTIAATIAAGPLNYVGVNPKLKCPHLQPSK
jgi:ABC-type molybdate transport system permease subunit